MKVANKTPAAVKSPVRITENRYAMWYARPVNLGEIRKEGNYWYTADGMRFVSSRNALDYLIKIRELVEHEVGIDKLFADKVKGKEVERKGAQPGPAVVKSKPKARKPSSINRAEFEKFIKSLGYKKIDEPESNTKQ